MANTSTILRIEHKVDNFDFWKRMFDNDPIGRQKSDVRRYRIMRPTDDPNYVMIDLEFDGAKEAENFRSALLNLWGTLEEQKIMQNPQLRIVELLETKTY